MMKKQGGGTVAYIPEDIILLLSRMEENGVKAYMVGGAVRDCLMGREPCDYDICSECTPLELLEIFKDFPFVDMGIRFGTLCVFSGNRYVEITCCRRESGYSDRRRPDSVEFCKNIEEDLARRDFCVNAIAMDARGQITDPFEGRKDIENKVIRAVGDPNRRFCEDALRIIRAVRFESTLGFEMEEGTKKAVKELSHLLLNVSGERVFTELKKLLLGDNVFSVLMEYKEVICTIIPELSRSVGFAQNNPHHIYTVYEHIAKTVEAAPKDINIRLCMLLHDVAKPEAYTTDDKGVGHFYGHPAMSERMAKDILKRLKADGETVKKVCFLVRYHDTRPAATRKSLRKYLSKVGFEGARELLSVRRADLAGQSPAYFDQFDYLSESERIIDSLEKEGACISLEGLSVKGSDLIEIGIPKGKAVGEMLSYLLEKVVKEEAENEKEHLLKLAKKKAKLKLNETQF